MPNLDVLLDALRNHNMEQLVVKCRAVSCRDQTLDKRIKLDNWKLNNWLDKERNSTSDAGINFEWWISSLIMSWPVKSRIVMIPPPQVDIHMLMRAVYFAHSNYPIGRDYWGFTACICMIEMVAIAIGLAQLMS
jgi:hypothetical protein